MLCVPHPIAQVQHVVCIATRDVKVYDLKFNVDSWLCSHQSPKKSGRTPMDHRIKGGVRQYRKQSKTEKKKADHRIKGGVRQHMTKRAQIDKRKRDKRMTSEHAQMPIEDSTQADAEEKYRDHMERLFLRDKLAGKDAQQISKLSTPAGAAGVKDYGGCGTGRKYPGNTTRDLLNKIDCDKSMPPLYWGEVPVRCGKTNSTITMLLTFLLLHEMLHWLLSKKTILPSTVSTFPSGSGQEKHHRDFCQENDLDPSKTAGIGLHGGGVQHQHKNQTVEACPWDFPAIPSTDRVLFALTEKQFLCRCGCMGRHTVNAIMNIFVWGMSVALGGEWPDCRHDNEPWGKSDNWRKSKKDLQDLGGD